MRVILLTGSGGKQGAIAAAKKAKDQLGDRLCIYPIQIGNEDGAEDFMNELAAIGGCGFATNAMDISSPKTMAGYVIKPFSDLLEMSLLLLILLPIKLLSPLMHYSILTKPY